MDNVISKKLLSEVLSLNEFDRKYLKITLEKNKVIVYVFKESKAKDGTGYHSWSNSLNFHELAHKCKEWAFIKHRYIIDTSFFIDDIEELSDFKGKYLAIHYDDLGNKSNAKYSFSTSIEKNEATAAIKGAEFIYALFNKEKQ